MMSITENKPSWIKPYVKKSAQPYALKPRICEVVDKAEERILEEITAKEVPGYGTPGMWFPGEAGIWKQNHAGLTLRSSKMIVLRNHNSFIRAQSMAFVLKLNAVMRRIQADVLRRLREVKKDEQMPWDMWMSQDSMASAIFDQLNSVFVDVTTESGTRAIRQVGDYTGSFDLTNELAAQSLQTKEMTFANQVSETTTDNLRDTLEEGFRAGESYNDLAARVQGVMQGYSQAQGWQALRVARTEINSASNMGLFLGFKQKGVKQKQWLSAADARPWHLEASGQVVNIDEPFDVDDEPMMFPGDPSGSPENVINCRCVTRPFVQKPSLLNI